MAALLAERPRSGSGTPDRHRRAPPAPVRADDGDNGWLRRLRDRRTERARTRPIDAEPGPPGPAHPSPGPPCPAPSPQGATPLSAAALGGDTIDAGMVAPSAGAYAPDGATRSWDRPDDEPFGVLGDRPRAGYDDGYDATTTCLPRTRRTAPGGTASWSSVSRCSPSPSSSPWPGGSGTPCCRCPAPSTTPEGSTPSASAPADGSAGTAPAGTAATIVGAEVFDPQGDGDPDHPEDAPLAFDGDPATAWSTYEYRGSPAFGNLKDGLGLLLDLGDPQQVAGVTLTSTVPGATVEIRTGDEAADNLDGFDRRGRRHDRG